MHACGIYPAAALWWTRKIALPGALFLLLATCSNTESPVPPVMTSKELVVITRESPTTLYMDPQGNYTGLEFDLVSLFAQQLGVKFWLVTMTDFSQTVPALLEHKGHLAATGLTITAERETQLAFSIPYQTIRKRWCIRTIRPSRKTSPISSARK
jgi:membrane-bound lytic murein transglycosylase F